MEYLVLLLAALFAVASLVTIQQRFVSCVMAFTSAILVCTLAMAVS